MPVLRYYITGHGLGHASRSCRIISALLARAPGVRCQVVTDAAPWFLADNLPPETEIIPRALDVGVRQSDSLIMRPEATVQACRRLRERAPALIAAEAEAMRRDGVALAATDVAALPCAAAAAAGIPAVIVSNFTWAWIYEGFLREHPAFAAEIAWQAACYRQAALTLRLPFYGPMPTAEVIDLPLVTRRSRLPRAAVRARLGLKDGERLGLLSFGGFGLEEAPLDRLEQIAGWVFLAEPVLVEGRPRMRPLPADIAYPDLVGAADAVVTKPGYGIVAECLALGTPVLYTPRGDFREQPLLVAGLHRYGRAVEIDNEALRRGDFGTALEQLLALPQPGEILATDGAETAAGHLARLLS